MRVIMQDQEYQLVTMVTNNQYYYMLIKEIEKPITEVDHKYFVIPLDHITADLLGSYDRIQIQIHKNLDKTIIFNKIKTFDKIKTSVKKPTFYINELHAFDVLVDFITLGDMVTRDTKREFIKNYVANLTHQRVFRN